MNNILLVAGGGRRRFDERHEIANSLDWFYACRGHKRPLLQPLITLIPINFTSCKGAGLRTAWEKRDRGAAGDFEVCLSPGCAGHQENRSNIAGSWNTLKARQQEKPKACKCKPKRQYYFTAVLNVHSRVSNRMLAGDRTGHAGGEEKAQESPLAERVRFAERSEALGLRYKIIIFVHVFPCLALSPWPSRGVD